MSRQDRTPGRTGGLWTPFVRAKRRVIANNQSLTNPAAYTVTPNATDRTNLQLSFRKERGDTRLELTVLGSIYQSSGVAQNVYFGLTPDGGTTTWDVGQIFLNNNNVHTPIVGTNEVLALAAGTYTIEPIWKSSGASVINWDASNDIVSFSVVETR